MLVIFALLITLSEVGLHVWASMNGRKYSLSWAMLFVALIMGFVGMFILNPGRAKEGGRFIVDNTIRVLQVVRQGRRKSDAIAVVLEDHEGNTGEIVVPSLTTGDDHKYEEHKGRRVSDIILPPHSEEHTDGP